jgi:hypothetical protein
MTMPKSARSHRTIAGAPIRTIAEVIEEDLARDPLREFHVWWDEVTEADAQSLLAAIDAATREEDVQSYLQAHPSLLVQSLGGGHGRWVLPKHRLGSQFVTDFVIGDRDSLGRRWMAVELEAPSRPMFNRRGDPSRYLNHAMAQVLNWRSWLITHRAYAVTSRAEGGLGLEDIDGNVPGLVVIGRRGLTAPPAGLRRRLEHENRIEIHTYDWLVERIAGRAASVKAF